jgi:thymidylate synthase (FAD)
LWRQGRRAGGKLKVKLVAVTRGEGEWAGATAEQVIMRAARASNPENQLSDDAGLLRYCMRKGHWSIWETASMTVQIETSRAIAAQIIRHRSFTFQEFSQRYAKAQAFEPVHLRYQDNKNRQSSLHPTRSQLGEVDEFEESIRTLWIETEKLYNEMIEAGIAKESARFILPMNTQTRLYMTGNARSWMFYLKTRLDEATQFEHRQVATEVESIFAEVFPITYSALSISSKQD